MASNYYIAMKKQESAEKRWLKYYPKLSDASGIYILTREDENGFIYAYCGQALHLLKRLGQHLLGYSHIDLSLKKRGIDTKNKYAWKLMVFEYDKSELDNKEREWISTLAETGHQLYNKTIGGQDSGKSGLGENKSGKGYYDGLEMGEKRTLRLVKTYFDKYLDFSIKGTPNKIKERKLKEFQEWLDTKID